MLDFITLRESWSWRSLPTVRSYVGGARRIFFVWPNSFQWQCLSQSKDAIYDVQDHKFRCWCRTVSRTAHKEPRILHWTCNKVNQERAINLSILTLSVCLKKIRVPVLIHIHPAQSSDFILDFNCVLTLGFCHGSAPTPGRHPWSLLFAIRKKS